MNDGAPLSTWPDHLGLGVGCSATALAVLYAVVAMALPGGLFGLTTVFSGCLVIVGGTASGWALAARYFSGEPVVSGTRALHFPVAYQFEDYVSWRYSTLSALDALSYVLETLGQVGWLLLMPLDRVSRWMARQARR